MVKEPTTFFTCTITNRYEIDVHWTPIIAPPMGPNRMERYNNQCYTWRHALHIYIGVHVQFVHIAHISECDKSAKENYEQMKPQACTVQCTCTQRQKTAHMCLQSY